MSDSNESYVAENGLTLGITILALLVIFGVGIPRWFDEESAQADVPVELPEHLGQYTLVPAGQSPIDTEGLEKSSKELLDAPVVSGMYQNRESQAMLVQATRTSTGTLISPGGASEYTQVDGLPCVVIQSPAAACQKSEGSLTVLVTSPSGAEDAAKQANAVFDELA